MASRPGSGARPNDWAWNRPSAPAAARAESAAAVVAAANERKAAAMAALAQAPVDGAETATDLPLAVGFVVIGYLSTIGLAFSNRASVRKIVERSRHQRLALFRSRIDAFAPRMVDLAPEESERLRDLLFLHDRIRDAPASTTTTHTVVRTAAGLLIPTIAFVITVFGEVSAERILDAFLP